MNITKKPNQKKFKEIQVSNLCPGIKFDAPVYIDEDNLLLVQGMPLKQKEIERLHLWDIESVFTEGNIISENTPYNSSHYNVVFDERIDENKYHSFYTTAINRFEEIILDIKDNIKVIPERIEAIVRDLLSLLSEDKNTLVQLVLRGRKKNNSLALSSVNCCIISMCIGMKRRLLKHRIFELGITALLHDIGMIRIPENIYNKKTALKESEFEVMKHHLIYSYIIILNELGYHKDIAEYSLFHHENWDGSGYSKHLTGEKIPLISRIIAVADTYVAMIADRPYKAHINGYEAMKTIISNNGQRFDPVIIRALLESVGFYPIGSIVRLNNYLVGRVIEFSTTNGFRPKVQIINESKERGIRKNEIVDLYESKNLFIESIVE
ncbi:MAG: HD-GYP domain-containing protein [Spirochaetales bacterium]|nr:HD-GYP domain-containing protein [Spirochaetales bacterium]